MAFLYSITVVNKLMELALKLRTGEPFEMSDEVEATIIEDAVTVINRKDSLIGDYIQSVNEEYHDKLDALAKVAMLESDLDETNDNLKVAEDGFSYWHRKADKLKADLKRSMERESIQFKAKWDALTKLDDYMDTIEELRAENEALKAERFAETDSYVKALEGVLSDYLDRDDRNRAILAHIGDIIDADIEGDTDLIDKLIR